MGLLDRLLAALELKAETCPGCGRELVSWQEDAVRDGYAITRLWTGCPEARRLHDDPVENWSSAMAEHFAEINRHYAKWVRGTTRPLHSESGELR